MITILIELLIAALVIALFVIGLNAIPGLPAWVKPVFCIIAAIVVLLYLLGGGTHIPAIR